MSDSVEVSQARQSVASADLDYITALFAHNLAKLSLARSLGGAEKRLGAYLGRDLTTQNRMNPEILAASRSTLTPAK